MAQHDDSLSLHWVRGEIQDTLRQSQHALEAFAENREDLAQLRFCLNHLHQVHGTLRMVQLEGASLVAAEMEALAEALLNGEPEDSETAIGSLMQSILQLPDYLSTLQSRSEDVPLRLLPLLNELRAARGETFLSASALFNPDLSPAHFEAPAQVNQRLTASGVLDKVHKLQQMFQFARAGLERGVDVDTHLDYLDKVITRLIKLCQRTPQGEIWQAAGALIDTLGSGHNELGAAAQALISELDDQLERLISESDTILSQSVPEDTLKNLLYYVARGADCESERVSTMVERYHLREALPDDTGDHGQSQAPARAAMASVVDVLTEELNTIKDRLDLFVRAHQRSNADLAELLPGLRQVANTLAMLRQGTSQRVINDQIERIDQLAASTDAVDDGTLMDIAGALLYVEASISGLSDHDGDPDTEQSTGSGEDPHRITGLQATEAGSAVLRESRNALEQVKTGVVNFIASQWNTEAISGVPELLYSIRGSLHLIPLERTATALGACERFIQEVLIDGAWTPNWEQLDTLADAITSIEYHLERLMDGIDDNDAILAMAEERLENLGFPPGREPTRQAPQPEADEGTETALTDTAAAATTEPPKERDSELLDDDILEIFVEEADEVLETIQQHYPAFRADHENHQALGEVRRAFHTLKGSGRLVGATSIGELAWSVENLLNRVLDRSIQPGERIMSLLDRVIERLPGLIQSFRDGEATGDVDDLMNEAH
ncbi:MAG: Hpt domain-containing protein, partial [Pseudomonadota bacterium]